MRYFLAILTVLSAFTLNACGGSDDDPASADSSRLPEPTASLTEMTIPCTEFEDTAAAIAKAQADLYEPAGADGAIDALVSELDALKDGAPADVQAALDDLADGFRAAQELLADPSAANQKALADVVEDLSTAGQKVTAYVVEQCR